MRKTSLFLAAAIAVVTRGGGLSPVRADEVTPIFATGQLPGAPVATEAAHRDGGAMMSLAGLVYPEHDGIDSAVGELVPAVIHRLDVLKS